MRAGCEIEVAVARGARPEAAGVERLVGTRGGGSDVVLEAGGGGGAVTVREGFARAADRERVLSEIRWTTGGVGAEMFARGPKRRKSVKSAAVGAGPSKTALGGRGRGPPMCMPVSGHCKSSA